MECHFWSLVINLCIHITKHMDCEYFFMKRGQQWLLPVSSRLTFFKVIYHQTFCKRSYSLIINQVEVIINVFEYITFWLLKVYPHIYKTILFGVFIIFHLLSLNSSYMYYSLMISIDRFCMHILFTFYAI